MDTGDVRGAEVRTAEGGDVPALAAMLGRAFFDDPVSCFVFPDEGTRRRGLRRFFHIQLHRAYLGAGHVYTTGDGSSAALWKPPGPATQGLMGAVRLTPLVPMVGRRLPAVLRLLGAVESHHPQRPHWYLGVLGTEPSLHGRGLGSAVMAPVLRRCDEDGVAAYLESSKERNVPFYRRHGFEVTRELRLPGAPPLWLMWRRPRPRDF